MSAVRITTLGGFNVAIDGRRVDWLTSQRMRAACLVYVAVEGEVSRDRLLALFWPESDLERARRSLTQLIYTIRRSLGEATILTDGDRVRIGPAVESDFDLFRSAVAAGQYDDALRIYRGRFLADTTLAGSAEFEQWLDTKRVLLERLHRRARRTAIEGLSAGEDKRALALALEWCDLDPEDDEAHHRYIELLIKFGRRVEAVRHFEQYSARLQALELQPMDETVALIASLRARDPPLIDARSSAAAGGEPMHRAPTPAADPSGLGSLLHQLKRRRVFGALGMYLVLAWGAIEVSNTVFPLLGLPEWGPRLIAVLALVGFPFALFFSWQYDLTRRGVERPAPTGAKTLPRAIPPWATALAALPVVGFAVWSVSTRLEPAPSNGTVAVFPFCVAGQGLENEADDVAVLLAGRIDAIPELQSTDSNVLLPAAENARVHCRDAKAANQLARKLGAARFLLGSITSARGEIHANATMYDVDAGMLWAVTTQAASEVWTQVVDSLMRKIVEQQGLTVGSRMLSLAAAMTSDQQAMLAYLEGERALRGLEWNEASEHYSRAVSIDTTFALAWFRLAESLLSGGGPIAERRKALQEAKRYAAKLPAHEQSLLHAFDAHSRGVAAEAVDRLHKHLDIYPADPQAWLWLGEAEYQWGGILNHDRTAAIMAWRKGAELGNRDALFGLAWAYNDAGDYARSDSVKNLVLEVGAGGDWVIGIEAAHVFRSGDPSRIEAMLERIDKLPEWQRSNAPLWALWSHRYELAERLAERALQDPSPTAQRDAVVQLLDIREARGKVALASQLVERVADIDPARALQFRIDRALAPSINLPALRALRQEFDAKDRVITSKAPEPKRIYEIADRLYQLGRISVALGDLAAADRYADEAATLPATEDAPTGNANVAAALRAHIAIAKHDTAAALEWLDRMTPVLPPWAGLPKIYDLAAERLLRAEILARRGQTAEAIRAYTWSDVSDAKAIKRLGELYEQAGDRTKSVRMYERLRDLLAECDREHQPLLAFGEQRLAALKR